jgi:hypothetical protein
MALDESIAAAASLAWLGEQGGGRVKSEIGRVKSWSSLLISRFTIHSCPSAELSVVGFSGRMEALV